MMLKETPKLDFSFSIRNSGVVWLGNLPGKGKHITGGKSERQAIENH